MKTKGSGAHGSAQALGSQDGRGRRRLLAGLAAISVAPATASEEPEKIAGTAEEALNETYAALKQGAEGAGRWDTSDAKEAYMDVLRGDFGLWYEKKWKDEGDAVKVAAMVSGALAALIAKGEGAAFPKLTPKHVFMGAAIVKASKACPSGKREPRGRFCANAKFGDVDKALKALLKE